MNMKQLVKIKILAIFVASLFILSACDREKMDFGNESDGYGQIQLSSMQLSVDVNATPLSRAVTVDAGSYIVGIYNEDGTTLISEWKYSDMPEIFQLKVGKYKIIAHSPDGGEPVFDVPYCQGSQSIEIQKDQVTNVAKIECKLHCIMVKIGYTDELKPLLGDDTEVTVTINSNDQLTFKMGDEVRAAYFPANESGNIVDFKFLSTLTEDGIKDEVQTVNTRSVSGVSIGYLVTMTYKLSDADGDPNTGGDANASVKVDNSCDVENINGGVRPDEPEIDDFPDGGGDVDGEPTITCKKFDYVLDETVTEENVLSS